MNKHKLYLLTVASLLLMAGCTEDTLDEGRGQVPVQLTTQLTAVDAGATRAGTSLNNTALTSGDVGVFLSGDYTTKYTYTAGANGALSSASPAYYPASGNINIVAVYPASATDNASTAANFTVLADQREDAAYMSSDLMRGIVPGVNKTSGVQAVALNHKMAKIIVNVTAGDGVSSISSVTLNNIKRQIAYTASTDVLGTAAQIEGTNVQVGTNNCAAVIPPQTIAASTNFLTIETNAGTAVYQFAAAKELQAGNYYQLNITVNRTATLGTNTIAAWDGSGSANVAATTTAGELEIGTIPAQTYTGSALTPVPATVKYGSTTLTSGTHYELRYTNNISAGTATVTAVGLGTYAGKVGMKEFTINKAAGSISYATTTIQKYVGDATFTNSLTKTGDGTVTYSSSAQSVATVNANSGVVTVVGAGTATITATVADGSNYTYATKTCSYTLNVSSQPAVGMMYFTDGTYGNTKGSKTVAGIIVYVDQSGTDDDELTEKSSGFGHALVMALSDVSATQTWGPTNTDESFLSNSQSLSACQSNNKSGLSNTASLIGDAHTHNAASSARSFSSPAAPESKSSSKWFLPSAAQWYAVLASPGLGGLSAGSLTFSSWFDSSQTSLNAINSALTKSGVGGTALTNNAPYWSSSEYDSSSAVGVYFNSSSGVIVSGSGKSRGYRVRAFLAF